MDEDTVRIVEELRRPPKPISSKSQKGKNTPYVDDYFMPRTTPGAQPSLKSVLQNKQIVEKCDKAIAKWMIDASMPFNAVNSTYYQPMIDAISSMSPGIRGPLLNMWVDEERKLVESYKEVWKETRYTLMVGTVFLWSVDASYASKTVEMLFKLFKEMVLYVGAENVVHIVTDNVSNYVAADRLLEKEFPKIYWSPCATHCINLMLQNFGKFEEVSEIVSHASKITKYIYNHCYALFLMRQHTGGRDMLRPALTRFATNFIALQSILAQKDALRAMVTSRDWIGSTYAKDSKAKKFVKQILDSSFWKQCAAIVKLTEPLVHVLCIVDNQHKPAMGFLYQAMYKAREKMRNKRKVEPYLEVLDRRWDSQLCKDLHVAGYWLNSACRFNAEEFKKHRNTQSSILKLIDSYTLGDLELQDKLNEGMRIYKILKEILQDELQYVKGTQSCQINCGIVMDVVLHNCKNWLFILVVLRAVKEIGHFDQFRNRLRQQNYDPINSETPDDHFNWVLEESPSFLTCEEMEALHNDLANMSIQSTSYDIDKLKLDEYEDDDVPQHQATPWKMLIQMKATLVKSLILLMKKDYLKLTQYWLLGYKLWMLSC
ncbi:hypothetical protein GmHk_01G000908 [Glycine max]|nr:hypothetical protein GmHk_01G000908 [Glycine max]